MDRGSASEIAGDVLPQELKVDIAGIEPIGTSFLWAFSETGRERRIRRRRHQNTANSRNQLAALARNRRDGSTESCWGDRGGLPAIKARASERARREERLRFAGGGETLEGMERLSRVIYNLWLPRHPLRMRFLFRNPPKPPLLSQRAGRGRRKGKKKQG